MLRACWYGITLSGGSRETFCFWVTSCSARDALNHGLEHLVDIVAELALGLPGRVPGRLERMVHEVVQVLQIQVGVMKVALLGPGEHLEQRLGQRVVHPVLLAERSGHRSQRGAVVQRL
jgi:hypothetical protein